MSERGPAGPNGFTVTVSFSPRRSSSSKFVRPVACCTMLMIGRSRRTSMKTTRPAAKSIGVEQPDVGQHDTRQQRPADLAHLDRSPDRVRDGGTGNPGEQRAAGMGADEGVERAEEAGEQADQRPERDAQ